MNRNQVKDIVKQCVGVIPQEKGVDTWKQLIEILTDEICKKEEAKVCQYTEPNALKECLYWRQSKSGCTGCPLIKSRVKILDERFGGKE